MSEPLLRPGNAEDGPVINEAFNRVFDTSRSLEAWRWKFLERDTAPILLAEDQQGLLAQYAALPATLQIDGRCFPAAQVVDVFSTRRARRLRFGRRPLMVATAEAFFERNSSSGAIPVLFGLPGRRHLKLGVLSLGYDAMPPQPVAVFERPGRGGGSGRARYRAEPLSPDDPVLDELWTRLAASHPVAVRRDRRRYERRLVGNPERDYHLFGLRRRFGKRLVGLAVFAAWNGKLAWVDSLVDPAENGAIELLCHLTGRLAPQLDCNGEVGWLVGGEHLREGLTRHGFTFAPHPEGIHLVARDFTGAADLEAVADRFFFTLFDSDLI